MRLTSLIDAASEHVRRELAGDSSGHDWWHIWRVWRTAVELGRAEGADLNVVELAAWLHDLGDWKRHQGDEQAGPRLAREFLEAHHAPADVTAAVCDVIDRLSYRGAGVATPMPTLEGRIVQDADRLDALGAIGIARAFAYGGHAGRLMYDPGVPPVEHASFAAYKANKGPTINHFYEKLLLLPERMQTPAGRRLAEERRTFLRQFLDQFYAEWGARPSWDAGVPLR